MLSETKNIKLILGSSSTIRLELLKQINCYPNDIFKPEINEDPQKKELPISYVKRMAREKMNVVKKMKEVNAVVGGEGGGGIIYPDLHYGRDALVGIALFLSLLVKKGSSVSNLKDTA